MRVYGQDFRVPYICPLPDEYPMTEDDFGEFHSLLVRTRGGSHPRRLLTSALITDDGNLVLFELQLRRFEDGRKSYRGRPR